MQIGKVIRVLRKERDLSLESLAFDAATDASNLSRIERGIQQPTEEGLQSIATPLTQNSGEGSPVGKGEIFPASHSFDVGHRDRIGRLFSMWWVELLRRINARVMRLRTGKINHYVLFALAFLALIFILSILNLL